VPYVPKEWETVACPFCGETRYSTYERFGNTQQYTYVKCRQCGLIYQNPHPKYDTSFVYDAYEHYAEGILKNCIDSQLFFRSENIHRQEDDLITEILRFDTQHSSMLDVGCFTGFFIFSALKQYPKVVGVDVSTRMAKFVEENLKVKVYLEKFEHISTDEKFSCINMSHVIEHIPNPKDWLEQSKKLLTEGGILVISVPNMLSISRRFKVFLKRLRLRKGKWESWRTPDHLFEPTIPSILRFLDANGFDVIHYKTYSRKKMVDNSAWGRWMHQHLYWGSNIRLYAQIKNHTKQ
jgi:2-polyprenyl-3-methyl-5-hydroxy-6-metoxy-1,4-benzoquinol methylase